MSTVGKKVASARIKAKLTQQGLADRAGLKRSWVVSLETGRMATPSAAKLERVARELGLNYRELLALTNQLGAEVPKSPDSPEMSAITALLSELVEEVRRGREAQETIAQAVGEVAAYLGLRARPGGRPAAPSLEVESGSR